MEPENNSLPLSSPLPDQDKSKIASSGDEESLFNNPENDQADVTRTLTRFAEQAKLEGSVYRKLLDELKKMANQKP
ncbi:MAG: hypothetical protein NT004_04400 [Bacteroidetes bacterium]|nr:hypothetical protein [Bacteroidota bacterium]